MTYYNSTNFAQEPGGLRRLDDFVNAIRAAFPKNPSEVRVLDVGCGSGNISRPLAALGYDVTAIDMDSRATDELRKTPEADAITIFTASFNHLAQNKGGVSAARVATSPADPFSSTDENGSHPARQALQADNSEPSGSAGFDVIIMSEVLEHMPDPAAAAAHARELLTPNGLLLVTVPNGWCMEEMLRRMANANPLMKLVKRLLKKKMRSRDVQSPSESPHVQFFTLRTIQSLIRQAGFAIDHARGSSSLIRELYYIVGRFIIRRDSSLFHRLDTLDGKLTDHMPTPLASGWILHARKS